MNRESLIRLAHNAAWVVVVIISLVAKTPSLLPATLALILGIIVFAGGLAIFGWAMAYLRQEVRGIIEPASERFLEVGPYQYVRHPLYLGVIIALIGLALALQSLWGVVATVVLFIPLSIYRARLEESAIARRFGSRWKDYVRDTSFMFPPLY